MTGSEHSQIRRAIQACRDAGLPVVDPDDCTCSLSGRLVVLARPDGLKVVWPYEQRCPVHGPRDRDDAAGADSRRARARRPPDGRGHHGTRAGDEPRRPRSRRGSWRPGSTPCSARTPRSPDGSTQPNSDCSARTIGSGGVFTPTASPPSTASTPPRSTSRSPSTAPRCSALPTRSQQSSRSTGKSTRAFIGYQTAAEERRQLAAEIGELIRQFVDALVTAGWTEVQARNANVHQLATNQSATPRRN